MGSCLSSENGGPRPNSPRGVRKRRSSKRRFESRSSSIDYRREESLHRTPGRLFLNGSSEIASLFSQQGKKGTNQDAMLVWENFVSGMDTVLCGVFDGHGPYGHFVAKRVRDLLPLILSSNLEEIHRKSDEILRDAVLFSSGSIGYEEPRASVDFKQNGKNPYNFQTLKECFLEACKVMDRELRLYSNIDCFCSGTTAVTLVKQGQDILIGNIGDSRAVLGMRDENGSLTAVQLTVDLKPNLPEEEKRIRKCKGRVFALEDEPDVARVWLPHNDSPGLAMARAFGDFCLKDFGLISVPEISYRHVTDKDDFVVLATDGIWDVLSNEEVVEIVGSSSTRSRAARTLVHKAVKAWRTKYPTSKIDDCAVVCLFLDSNESIGSSTKSKDEDTLFSEQEEDEDNNNNNNIAGLSSLNRGTVRTGNEGCNIEKVGAEAVSRVNTTMNVPRFEDGDDAEKIRARK